jgi:uncharacterized protein YbjT (DUF2867 family)
MRIVVAGGTGLVGRLVVAAVEAAGHEPVVVARSVGVDVLTGAGIDAAFTGVDSVIDVTNVQSIRRRASLEFFGTATRTLLAAGARAGVRHHVALSVVGADRVDYGYYAGKRVQEELVLDGTVPGTVVRATQFHEFVEQLTARSGPVVLVPRMRSQPIAAREVAGLLVARAGAEPVGVAPELAGPEVREMSDMARALLRQRGSRRRSVAVRIPGRAGRDMAEGGLLPTGGGPRGVESFDEWLARSGSSRVRQG